MAVVNHTISGSLPLLSGAGGPEILEAYIESSEPAVIIAGEEIQLGSWPIPITTGDWTFAQALPASDEGGQMYRVVIRYYDPGPGKVKTWRSAYFELAADVDVSTVPSATLPVVVSQETYDNILQARDDVLGVVATSDGIMTAVVEDPESAFAGALQASTAALTAWAKNPDQLVVGAITYSSGLLSTAAVVWPDGATGALAITSRQALTDAITGYTITRIVSGQPTKTYTQPTITRDSSGNPTSVPQITVA